MKKRMGKPKRHLRPARTSISGINLLHPRVKLTFLVLFVLLISTWLVIFQSSKEQKINSEAQATVGLSVQGNKLVNAQGQQVILHGVDKSGSEYACIQGWGMFSGPSDDTFIQEMVARHIQIVRIPLNEDCWLGINGVSASYGGTNYQQAIVSFVSRLNAQGIYAEPEMQWGAAGSNQATDIEPMPDADHATTFWQSMAVTFKGYPGVLFNVMNEPHDVSWSCWKDGGSSCSGLGYTAVGFQQLVTTIRNAGAHQPIVLDGLGWANDLTGWLANKPIDPDNNLVAGLHVYPFNGCASTNCYDAQIAPVAAQVPVLMGEFGPYNNSLDTVWGDTLLFWADAHPGIAGYLAWTYNSGFGTASLLNSDDKTLTTYGIWYFNKLASITPAPTAQGPTVIPSLSDTTSPTSAISPTPTSPVATPTFFCAGGTNCVPTETPLPTVSIPHNTPVPTQPVNNGNPTPTSASVSQVPTTNPGNPGNNGNPNPRGQNKKSNILLQFIQFILQLLQMLPSFFGKK